MVHTVSVTFHQSGTTDVYESINNVWNFIHTGISRQSRAFALNVMKTLDADGYAVKMTGANSFEFQKESKRSPSDYKKFSPKEHWYA